MLNKLDVLMSLMFTHVNRVCQLRDDGLYPPPICVKALYVIGHKGCCIQCIFDCPLNVPFCGETVLCFLYLSDMFDCCGNGGCSIVRRFGLGLRLGLG